METIGIDLFFTLVIITGWAVAMGFGALIAWALYERDDD